MASSLPWAASLLQTPPSQATWACEGAGVSSAAGPPLRKCLVPVQFVGKDSPLVGSTRPSRQPTLELRSAHFSLFQEPNAQTASRPPLPKHVCFVLSPEGSLGRWPGLCFEGEGAEGALKSDLPRDDAWLCSDPHKVLPLLWDSDSGKEDAILGQGCGGQGGPVWQGMGMHFTGIFCQALQPTSHQQEEMNNPWPTALLPLWYITPIKHRAGLPEERKPVLDQAWNSPKGKA